MKSNTARTADSQASAADTLTVESSDARLTASSKMEAFSSEFTLSAQEFASSIENGAAFTAGRSEVEIAETARVFAGESIQTTSTDFSLHAFEKVEAWSGAAVSVGTEDTTLTSSSGVDVSANTVDLLVDNRLELTAGESVSLSTEDLAVSVGDKFGFVAGNLCRVNPCNVLR